MFYIPPNSGKIIVYVNYGNQIIQRDNSGNTKLADQSSISDVVIDISRKCQSWVIQAFTFLYNNDLRNIDQECNRHLQWAIQKARKRQTLNIDERFDEFHYTSYHDDW